MLAAIGCSERMPFIPSFASRELRHHKELHPTKVSVYGIHDQVASGAPLPPITGVDFICQCCIVRCEGGRLLAHLEDFPVYLDGVEVPSASLYELIALRLDFCSRHPTTSPPSAWLSSPPSPDSQMSFPLCAVSHGHLAVPGRSAPGRHWPLPAVRQTRQSHPGAS